MSKKTIADINVRGKKVLLRADFNVPMKDGEITDDNRIKAELLNIKQLILDGGKIIIFSHLGKIKTEEDKKGNSLRPVAKRLSELLKKPVTFIDKTRGEELEESISKMENGDVLMLENTRFELGETKNDEELGRYWASLGDIFVNDAFGTAHRSHASNVGISKHLETVAGLLMQEEIRFFGDLENAAKPFVAIIGGAKVSDKIGVIDHILNKAGTILIGGGMAFTFLKAMGKEIGKSLVEEDKLDLALKTIEDAKKMGVDLVFPVDTVVSKDFSNDSDHYVVSVDDIPEDMMGLDIGLKTIELFKKKLNQAKTVVWNGPMGVFEMKNFAKGTYEICEFLSNLDGASTILGGGDSASAAIHMGFEHKFTHISTGGGASLAYLEGKELPGIAAISVLEHSCGCGNGRARKDHVCCSKPKKIQVKK